MFARPLEGGDDGFSDMTAGLLIAAPRSGSGKTLVTLGLLRALTRGGLKTAGAKNGPDYIDPAFHAAATGRASLNLDSWAMPASLLDGLIRTAAEGADLLLVEGSMGLFDGVAAPDGQSGASADLAARFGLPVLLVIDVSGQSQTAAAIVKGCDALHPRVRVAGVVLNKVGSDRHRRLTAEAVARAGFPVVGALPRDPGVSLPERHLGLVQAGETEDLAARLDGIAAFCAQHIDLAAVSALAAPLAVADGAPAPALKPPGQRIAIARDVAFSFLYPHIATGWRAAGAELVSFSPLADEPPPPDCDVCWLPGGYPELHAGRLAAATRFMQGLAAFAEDHPVHGECGGYMVLGAALTDAEGHPHAMAGLLGATFSFAKRKMTLGYRDVSLRDDSILGPRGTRLRGHEFHYATQLSSPDDPLVDARDAQGGPVHGGGRRGRVTGTFFHVVAAPERGSRPSSERVSYRS